MKKQLTPAGQLAKAQVPPEEQPYALPKGWKWVRLGGIAELSKEKCDTFQVDDKYVGLEHMEKNGGAIDFGSAEGILSTKSVFHVGDVLYGKLRPYLNKHGIADFDGVCSTDVLVFKTSTFADKRWLNWSFDRLDFIRYAVENSKGVNLPRVSAKEVLQARVPLPPLEEQQRIVQRIESLFAKLDAAEVRLNAVAATFAPRKAVLLRSAIHGKLTTLQDMCKSIFDGDHMPPPKVEEGVPFLVIANVHTGKLDFSQTRYVPQSYYDKLSTTRKPEKGDVLYTLVGSYGIPVLVDTDQAFCFQRHMGLLKPDHSKVETKYLWYALQLQNVFQQATAIAKGTAQLTVPIKGFRQLHIPLPPLPEQRAIVAQLDHLLSREHQAAVAVTRARTELRRLRAAILARAFRGEL
ncbi:MAG: restriction endonuclease subunit S [Selenomonadaceae bacterium]|nr:restriction endonuclease subunit S [Selenomonadaceae bacterium]